MRWVGRRSTARLGRVLTKQFAEADRAVRLLNDFAAKEYAQERARLSPGDFFGELSLLTDEPPAADVIATSVLRCLLIPDNELKAFLLKQPTVMYRMLQIEARRLRAANVWTG